MRTIAALLLVVCVGLGLVAYRQAEALRGQRRQVQQLAAKLALMSATNTLDFQEKCARQAREEFRLYGWDKHPMAFVLNHYDAKLNRCFMEVRDTDARSVPGTILTSETVLDAFEGKLYASYAWSAEKNKRYQYAPLLDCEVTSLSGEKTVCHSSEEFDELVKQFMK
jgi:hypothetical protein